MRLTKETLKKNIKEELETLINETFNEGIGDNFYGMYGNKTQSPKPTMSTKDAKQGPQMPELPSSLKPEHAEKIRSMLLSGDQATINQALFLVDTLTPESSFSKDFAEYLGTDPDIAIGSYENAAGPDDRIDLRKKIYDQVNQRAARLFPNDPDAAYDWAYDKIQKAGLMQEELSKTTVEGLMYEGDNSVLSLFEGATLQEGGNVCGACLFEQLQEASCGCPDLMGEAEYQGRKVTLNKPMRGDVKKFKVYVKDPKTGNVKKVNFGDPNMKIKKSNPKRRKSFRARHNCDNPGPKTKARYWSCKKW